MTSYTIGLYGVESPLTRENGAAPGADNTEGHLPEAPDLDRKATDR